MASLISATLKARATSAFQNLHDSFAREITAYQIAGSVSIATNSTYNSIYKKASQAPNQTLATISQTLNARIYYGEINENLFSPSNSSVGEQSKIRIPNGSALLVVDADGYEFLKSSKRVQVDGKNFGLASDDTPMGMFDRVCYSFLLTPIDT